MLSVDAPSSWDIENGPPKSGVGSSFMPTALISLSAPKPLVKYFKGRHFIGGRYVQKATIGLLVTINNLLTVMNRFVSPSIAEKYGFDVPSYEGIDQVAEIGSSGQKL